MEEVDYGELLPHEFEKHLAQRQVGYLPLGTLEWHGIHSALGLNFCSLANYSDGQRNGLAELSCPLYGWVQTVSLMVTEKFLALLAW